MKEYGGLHRRWLLNTVAVISTLGLVCVLVVTTCFATYFYSDVQETLHMRAESAAEFFADYLNREYDDYYETCVAYVRDFESWNDIELQFIDAQGRLVASSVGAHSGSFAATPEISKAISSRGVEPFLGDDPTTGGRIMAVSAPIIYSNGDVVGVLRYVTSTKILDHRITIVAAVSLVALLVIVVVMCISSNFYIRSILGPIGQITEKAKRIAGGTYGIQIEGKYRDEMGELVDTINEMSSQINQNEKMQTEFISNLSHELRTPLTAINGWSETILASEDLDQETRRGMRIIHSETRRLTEMVVDLLDFTRIQDGRMTLNIEQWDIRAEFEDTVYMYSSRLSQDGITLEYLDNDEDIPEIPCDAKRLRQVFLNVLDNAAKHGREGMRIDASIHEIGDHVVVRIRDYGPGIPEDEIPLVKKKFFKGSSKARGSGIGLAVCDEIVEMHGGLLILENAEGGGTLVTIRLPATQ